MAPTSFDIFDLNDAFAVDEVLTNRAPSSPEIVMPQFLTSGSALLGRVTQPELTPDADGLIPSDYARREALGLSDDRRSPNPWDPRMIVDLALNIEPLGSILECYGVDQATYDHLCTVPSFRRDLAVTMRELRENGLSYAKKAAVQAESYLLDVDEMIQDKSVPSSTRLSAIQWVTKMGRLEPREEKVDAGGASGTTVNLQINFAH